MEVTSEPDGRLEVLLTSQLTAVTGTVSDAAGAPVLDYHAIVFPAEQTEPAHGRRHRTRQETSDAQGRFRIEGLPPGDYLVAAVVDVEPHEAMSRRHPRSRPRVGDRGPRPRRPDGNRGAQACPRCPDNLESLRTMRTSRISLPVVAAVGFVTAAAMVCTPPLAYAQTADVASAVRADCRASRDARRAAPRYVGARAGPRGRHRCRARPDRGRGHRAAAAAGARHTAHARRR